MKTKLLLVEDNIDNRENLLCLFKQHNYSLFTSDFVNADLIVSISGGFHCIILTLTDMQKKHLNIINNIRENSNVPIMIIYNHLSKSEQISLYNIGVNTLIPTPAHPNLLAAQVNACIRLYSFSNDGKYFHKNQTKKITIADLTVNFDDAQAYIKGSLLKLTNKEFILLKQFVLNQGALLSYTDLITSMGIISDVNDFDSSLKLLRVYVCCLRKKIQDKSTHIPKITSEQSIGYRMQTEVN